MNSRPRLTTLLLLAVVFGACNRDEVTGLPALAASNEAGPRKLTDVIAFFTRQFNTINGGLAVMNSDGSDRRPVAGGQNAFEPSISPDGRRIAFSRGTSLGVAGIFTMNVDGTAETMLVERLLLNPGPVWSPGGCQIAFRSTLAGSGGPVGRISIINADGTGLRQVSPEPGPNDFAFDESPSWSPDGARLAFTRNGGVHLINVDGTGLTALPNEDLAINPSWSPDGQTIAYASLIPQGIHVRNVDGSNLVQVTTAAEGTFDGWPRWSPDGRQIVFSRFVNNQVQIFVIDANGTGAARSLTPDAVNDFMPDWGRRSSSTSRCDPGVTVEIVPNTVTIGLTKARQVTVAVRANGHAIDDPPVLWSSSNEAVATVTQSGLVTAVGLGQAQIRAAFGQVAAIAQVTVVEIVLRDVILHATEEFGQSELVVVRPDGSGRTRLTTDGRIYLQPDISPDGRRIAFAGQSLSGSAIYLMNADGSEVTPLVDRAFDGEPSWSPDGMQIAFRSDVQGPFGPTPRIFIVNVDGTGLRQLSPDDPDPNAFFFDLNPSWSPDGGKILFVRNGVMQTINADGTGLTPLPHEDFSETPDWSPDGTRIAYARVFPSDIVIRDADGSNPVAITGTFDSETNPRWSPDGRRLVFCRRVDSIFQLFTINADGTGESRLSANPSTNECQASWSPVP